MLCLPTRVVCSCMRVCASLCLIISQSTSLCFYTTASPCFGHLGLWVLTTKRVQITPFLWPKKTGIAEAFWLLVTVHSSSHVAGWARHRGEPNILSYNMGELLVRSAMVPACPCAHLFPHMSEPPGVGLGIVPLVGVHGGILALRAHCALLLDYVPPEEPPGTPLGNALRIR